MDGLTLVWREGYPKWQPLAEVADLKDALRAEGVEDGQSDSQEATLSRVPLDAVPLQHTFTSEEGLLYVYDVVDEDWKSSEVYEALLREQGNLVNGDEPTEEGIDHMGDVRPQDSLPAEATDFLREVLATPDVVKVSRRFNQARHQYRCHIPSMNNGMFWNRYENRCNCFHQLKNTQCSR